MRVLTYSRPVIHYAPASIGKRLPEAAPGSASGKEMLDLLDLSIGKSKREPTADEKLAALARETRLQKKKAREYWAESARIDTLRHAKSRGLVGYEMLRRKHQQKLDVEDWFRTLDITRDGSVDARELITPMAILGVAKDRAAVERLSRAINEKDADGEPGLSMDEFRDFAISNGLKPAELRAAAAKGSSELLAVETQISVARRRQMLDALMSPSAAPDKAEKLDRLRCIEKCAEWAACVDPPAPKARSTRPRRPFAARLDAELARRKRAAAVPPRYAKKSAAKRTMRAMLGTFDRTQRPANHALPPGAAQPRSPPRTARRRQNSGTTPVAVYRPGSSWPELVHVSTQPPDDATLSATASLRTVAFSASPVGVPG